MTNLIKNPRVLSVLLLLVTSCSLVSPPVKCTIPDPAVKSAAIKQMESFAVDTIEIDYFAKCKARIVNGDTKNSGACRIILTRNNEMQLTILHPLGGTLLEVYADESIIQVNDYSTKRYIVYPAGEIDKLDIPIFRNLSIHELQAILWGRITGKVTGFLEYELEDKKPKYLYKKGSELDLVITYQKWQQKNSVLVPRIINMKNNYDGSSIKLVITDFKPDYLCNLKLTNHFKSTQY